MMDTNAIRSPACSKLAQVDLPAVLACCGMADEVAASSALAAADTPERLLAALVAAGRQTDATCLLAHALPVREAVWWACMCARHTAPRPLPAPTLRVRDMVEGWVRQPGLAPAQQAMEAARLAGAQTPEVWAARAAFWSGPSLAPAGAAVVCPPTHLPGMAVASAVALAAIRGDATRREARLLSFLRSAHDIAAGGSGHLPMEAA
ncbi:hypothetical protein GLUCOINTEAF2_0203023 [Komagataeibacter intermedius AF2]|uniref:Uncharacterized protein n=1 Tax=Komagataeibacter intermedius AF2 TaxID=1458464 RepID=A0A0N0ME24_9PROT|nr:hypothetical protein [Komagataeibacter intermedius]KPH85986.1 hypothetical protein GLUCOINTEAF2_0203023 [Komagataeibacter intermedius AF2]